MATWLENAARKRGYWVVAELAELAGISRTRVRQLLLDGRQLHGDKAGQVWTVRLEEGLRWLDARQERD